MWEIKIYIHKISKVANVVQRRSLTGMRKRILCKNISFFGSWHNKKKELCNKTVKMLSTRFVSISRFFSYTLLNQISARLAFTINTRNFISVWWIVHLLPIRQIDGCPCWNKHFMGIWKTVSTWIIAVFRYRPNIFWFPHIYRHIATS